MFSRWTDIKKYRDLTVLLIKFGRTMMAGRRDMTDPLEPKDGPVDPHLVEQANRLTCELERLGPSYIKLGQFLSTRPDILPPPVIDSLSRLQDHVAPFPYKTVEETVAAELGVRISKAFAHFEQEPFASASLSQVHRARLRSGKPVAVKVQRPDIRARIFEDLAAMERIAVMVDRATRVGRQLRFHHIVEEFRKVVARELDFRVEAAQMKILKNNLKSFRHIVLPEPVDDYTSLKVLTMELIFGKKITKITPLDRTGLDITRLADEIFAAYLHQVLIDGVYHADPHPGNMLLTDDKKIGLVDLGMVADIPHDIQGKLLQFLLALNNGDGEHAAGSLYQISTPTHNFNREAFDRQINEMVSSYHRFGTGPMQAGRIVLDITRIAAGCGLVYPTELTMLGKTLLNLDQVAEILDPQFDANEAIRRHAGELTRHKIAKDANAKGLINAFFDTKELLVKMPERLNAFMDKLANNKLTLNVEMLDEKYLMTGFQKVANRLTTGIILAALIIGAVMMMEIQTDFTIMGYPGFAILLFLVAVIGGLILVGQIMFQDESIKRKG